MTTVTAENKELSALNGTEGLPPKKRGGALLRIARPGNGIAAAIAVLLGTLFASHRPDAETLFGMIAFFLLVSAGNSHNDLLDLPADRLNRPDRPIPSGAISPKTVLFFSFFAALLALLLGGISGAEHFSLVAGIALLLLLYNIRLKGFPRLGNATVSLLSATPFLWYNWPHPTRSQLAAALIAFSLTEVRELVKDFEDLSGDRAAGRKTLPIASGEKKAVQALAMRYATSFAIASATPLLAGWSTLQGIRFWSALILLVFPLLAHSLIEIRRALHSDKKTAPPHWNRAQKSVKGAMFFGMIALFLGTI